jgi:hypothetical protein
MHDATRRQGWLSMSRRVSQNLPRLQRIRLSILSHNQQRERERGHSSVIAHSAQIGGFYCCYRNFESFSRFSMLEDYNTAKIRHLHLTNIV